MKSEPDILPIRSVYELVGIARSKKLYIVGPAPSASGFPFRLIRNRLVVALNSAIEFVSPTWWMWSDKRFLFCYKTFFQKIECDLIIPYHQVRPVRRRAFTRPIWIFHYQMRLQAYEPLRNPYWYAPSMVYLPGRCSVASIAMSLATLMSPIEVVLIGIDFDISAGYYVKGIKFNSGPDNRQRSIESGFNWFAKMLRRNGWPDLRIASTSRTLTDRLKTIRHVSIDEAIYG